MNFNFPFSFWSKKSSISYWNGGLIPIMTSDTSPLGIASASSEFQGAWLAFDGDDSTTWISNDVNRTTTWLQYQFSTTHIVTAYDISFPVTTSTAEFKFQASNDGSSWATLDDQSGSVPSSSITRYNISNSTAYSYYRIQFTHNSTVNSYIGTWQLYGT